MTRAEHLAWAKERAIECCDRGEFAEALASMLSDLKKHPELENHPGAPLWLACRTVDQARKWIEGFN